MRISDWSSDVCSSDLFVRLRGLKPGVAKAISELLDLNGGVEVLARAREVLKGAGEDTLAALKLVDRIVRELRAEMPKLPIHIDQTGRASCWERGCPVRVEFGGRWIITKKHKTRSLAHITGT